MECGQVLAQVSMGATAWRRKATGDPAGDGVHREEGRERRARHEDGKRETGRMNHKHVPTAFSSMMDWALVLAADMASAVGADEKNRRRRNDIRKMRRREGEVWSSLLSIWTGRASATDMISKWSRQQMEGQVTRERQSRDCGATDATGRSVSPRSILSHYRSIEYRTSGESAVSFVCTSKRQTGNQSFDAP